jgi:hypothetical protein
MEVLSRKLPGETEEDKEITSIRTASVMFEILKKTRPGKRTSV